MCNVPPPNCAHHPVIERRDSRGCSFVTSILGRAQACLWRCGRIWSGGLSQSGRTAWPISMGRWRCDRLHTNCHPSRGQAGSDVENPVFNGVAQGIVVFLHYACTKPSSLLRAHKNGAYRQGSKTVVAAPSLVNLHGSTRSPIPLGFYAQICWFAGVVRRTRRLAK